MRLILFLSLITAAPAHAAPLIVRPGESWAFRLAGGEPVKARKVAADARPAQGEILVSVRAFLGTVLTAVNGTGRGYTFRAELLSGGTASAARSCALPAGRDPIIEQWPGKPADAVRLSRFRPAKSGNC